MSNLASRRTIVVGVDDSPTAAAAAHWAADLGGRLRTPLMVCTVVTDPNYYNYGFAYADLTYVTKELVDDEQTKLDRMRAQLLRDHAGLDIQARVFTGWTDQVLVELSGNARLTVVGAHGQDTLGSLLMGSTALRVANHANSAVVVWRGEPGKPVAGSGTVLVGVDGTELGSHAVAYAFEMAALWDTPLVALHASRVAPDEAEATLAESLTGYRDRYPDVLVEQIVQNGNPAGALLQWSRAARLVVVAGRGRNRAMAAMLGSTTQNLMHQLSVPLMICRGAA